MKLSKLPAKIIQYSFYLLFFITPLLFLPYNYELFEFNKMMLVYALTIIIVSAWIGKWIAENKITITKTPLDIPILLFLASQLISTAISIDIHTSIWGYYSRFHGGLLSTISYILLYYAFVGNMCQTSDVKRQVSANKTINCLYLLLASAFLVTGYGILEHFGIDSSYWVQDVRNRVFSTLGQPNWLGAWIDGLIIIPIAFLLTKKTTYTHKKLLTISMWGLFFIFYFCLLFTGSRSAYFGFLAAILVFLSLLGQANPASQTRLPNKQANNPASILSHSKTLYYPFIALLLFSSIFLQEWKKTPIFQSAAIILLVINLAYLQIILKKKLLKTINILLIGIITISLWLGTPINKPLYKWFSPKKPAPASQSDIYQPPLLISKSSDIRKVVWKGAVSVWRHYPVFGSGVETFAYSYYNYRPQEHNNLSEWDFLYNKAHNEYLNYLSTTGIVGLGAYLLIIGWFLYWSIKKKFSMPHVYLRFALIAGYSSILVTNFFGFSVVAVALLFWLFPAFVFSLTPSSLNPLIIKPFKHLKFSFIKPSLIKLFLLILLLIVSCYLLFVIARLWLADYHFSKGQKYSRASYSSQAHRQLISAILLNPNEALYHAQMSQNAAKIALSYKSQQASGSATASAQFTALAKLEAQQTLNLNPVHINLYKTIARTYIYLSQIDSQYCAKVIKTFLKAHQLSPTDPKITYNLALIHKELKKDSEAINWLEQTVELKPNYTQARLELAKLYYKANQNQKAQKQLEEILTYDPKNPGIRNLLNQWKKP